MSTEENKAILQRYFEEMNKGNVEVMNEIVSQNVVRHWKPGVTWDFGHTKETHERIFKEQGRTNVVDEMLAEGDRIMAWMTLKGGKSDRHFCFLYRFSDGKIAEEWNLIGMKGGFAGIPPSKKAIEKLAAQITE